MKKNKVMADKVQKILSEIATRKLCTMDEHMAFYNDKAKEDYRFLSEIEEFIKASQDEPLSDDLDDQRFAKEMDAVFALPSSETKNTEEEPLNWEYAIAKHFFELGLKEHQGNISDDLVEASRNYADNEEYGDDEYFAIKAAFDAGANWQKEHMMAKSVDAKVCNKAYPTKFEIETNTFIQKLNHGDNVKLIIIKEG